MVHGKNGIPHEFGDDMVMKIRPCVLYQQQQQQ